MAAVRNQASDKRKRSAVAQGFRAVEGRPMNTAGTPKQIKSKQAENKRQRKTAYAGCKKRRQRIAVVEELTAYAVGVASNNAAKKGSPVQGKSLPLGVPQGIGFESLRQSKFNHLKPQQLWKFFSNSFRCL
jgi:hypothetical protein